MIRLPRWFVFTVATLFVASPVVIGTIEFLRAGIHWPAVVALGLYFATGLASIYTYRQLKMPMALAILMVIVSIAVPQLVNLDLDSSAIGTPGTWYVTAVSTLLAICAVRQQRFLAWTGLVVLTIELITWGGTNSLFVSGLGGAVALVAASHVISVGLEASAKQTAAYLETAKQTQAASAAESAIRQERSERLTATLQGALPMLQAIAAGNLSEADRSEAALLEAELRDEIRGRALIDPTLKAAVRAARSRGVEVVVLDEGGLNQASESEKQALRTRLAQELDAIQEGRVTIRSPQMENVRATFVASRKGTAKPDVFLKL
ncbi:MAG: hypothetical protein RLZZ610_788 [Actinomycetota bacterium]